MSPPVTKYYPCAVHSGEVDLDRLSDIAASRSTLSKADCYAAIIALTQAIGESLSEGHIVRLDNLGTFQITLKGLPADSPEDLGKANIKKGAVIYKPSRKMKEVIKNLSYKRIR